MRQTGSDVRETRSHLVDFYVNVNFAEAHDRVVWRTRIRSAMGLSNSGSSGQTRLFMSRTIIIREHETEAVAETVRLLRDGRLVAIPTETVYGLAADATNGLAVASIFEAKGRPRFNPLICHMSDLAMAEDHADFDPLSLQLARAFWPGPLTLVLSVKATSPIHALTRAGLTTVGVRVPVGIAATVIAKLSRPLAAPSANRSGRISPTRASHVADDLGDRVALILDGGACAVGLESTIIKVENGVAHLLRPGGLSAEAIEAVLGTPLVRKSAGATIEAPGMMASHYAPDAAVRLNVSRVEPDEVLINFAGQTIAGAPEALAVFDLSPSGDLAEAAARLFDLMIEVDRLNPHALAFAPVPMEGLGEAINDRLARAAAPKA